jgi:hypothetical protein
MIRLQYYPVKKKGDYSIEVNEKIWEKIIGF